MALLTGLVGAVVTIVLMALAERTGKAAHLDRHGWKRLRSGWLLHGTIIGCAALSGVISYTIASGGSSLPDKESQDVVALMLAILFGTAAVYVAWISYGRTVA